MTGTRRYPIRLCSFSGSVAELTNRERRDPDKVLAVLGKDPMVSTWDMGTGGLWRTIGNLVSAGKVIDKTSECVYPWHRFVVKVP